MTAEGSTGAPLRQQIAEAIRSSFDEWQRGFDPLSDGPQMPDHVADAVVALLNLTEELGQRYSEEGSAAGDVVLPGVDLNFPGGYVVHRYCTPWLPSTPPDTSSSDPA